MFFWPQNYRRRVLLDSTGLDAEAHAQWAHLLEHAARALVVDLSVGSFEGVPPDEGTDFAFVAGSAALSRKLLLNLPLIYIQPNAAPLHVDAHFYWKSQQQPDRTHRWMPASHPVTLISSVLNGDDFLPGFLTNCAGLLGYSDYEHFLIRAGSPGQEHACLVDHVRRFPSAAYVNLRVDPGLYEVWNLGTRLATGRYLSNANIDDRRAPSHVTMLRSVLDENADVDTASTALRMTTQKNLAWEDSANCETLYAENGDQLVDVRGLFRSTATGWQSRNLPHCMPLWRRALHGRLGHFDERSYGCSADWAFWVRAGLQGSHFHLSARPLGLYLRHDASYWHREANSRQFDLRIVEEFLAASAATAEHTGRARVMSPHRPLSHELGEAIELLRTGAAHEGLGRLLDVAAREDCAHPSGSTLLCKVAEYFLGCSDFPELALRYRDARGPGRHSDIALFNIWVDLAHGLASASATAVRTLELACIDLSECIDGFLGLLLLALLARKRGNADFERTLLRHLHESDPRKFWQTVQHVYRFSVPLPELCETVSSICPRFDSERPLADYQVVFYPTVTGNAYLDLLHEPLRWRKGKVWGCSDEAVFLGAAPLPNRENVLHIHWINRLLWPPEVSGKTVAQRCTEFLDGLKAKKQQGFRIFWTIHNRLSHETSSAEAEAEFRRALYHLADRVFVHHPLAAELLDWLPDRNKLCLCEHGPYDISAAAAISRHDARQRLGLADDAFVLAHIGQIRDYKGLEKLLPLLPELLDKLPHVKVLISGRMSSFEVKSWCKLNRHPNLIVRDGHLSTDDLLCTLRAADFGLLSYSAILTSGSLFHWLTSGRPVLAPMTGTIPAYLVDGWNGYAYRDGAQLSRLLHHCAHLPRAEIDRMGDNARITAQQLDWSMWQQ
ncbi:MAG: hypothetical protein JNM98_21325 [Rhodocyclaceae bacterium]|nr:hypothetical protein [Rhodocyclaceae bacterium]